MSKTAENITISSVLKDNIAACLLYKQINCCNFIYDPYQASLWRMHIWNLNTGMDIRAKTTTEKTGKHFIGHAKIGEVQLNVSVNIKLRLR